MGLFDKLFGKKSQSDTPEPIARNASHKEEWDFYFSKVDDIIGSFYIDLGLMQIAPISNKPNLVWISVQMNNPREDGLSSSEEFESLKEIEDRLQEFFPNAMVRVLTNHTYAEHWRLVKDPSDYKYPSSRYYEIDEKRFEFLKDLLQDISNWFVRTRTKAEAIVVQQREHFYLPRKASIYLSKIQINWVCLVCLKTYS